jgi:hypothetical protein
MSNLVNRHHALAQRKWDDLIEALIERGVPDEFVTGANNSVMSTGTMHTDWHVAYDALLEILKLDDAQFIFACDQLLARYREVGLA